jgi:hypothetical protein
MGKNLFPITNYQLPKFNYQTFLSSILCSSQDEGLATAIAISLLQLDTLLILACYPPPRTRDYNTPYNKIAIAVLQQDEL